MKIQLSESKKLDILFVIISLIFGLVVAFCLPINYFDIDGWFRSQHFLFGKFAKDDNWYNYLPIGAPAIFVNAQILKFYENIKGNFS
ncbi:MAG: hypothetical protein EWV82_12830 [Microcystis aeruginosa Ma_AC_P_19900807_S299]|jgi:hypothetical protein|uniref:Uncharacterized protein n=1 Tax=Microcystis aeruginosa Ma_SC_T_19800800_S464 TaxID=2486257 RepID=A0A552E468_MICAE|nr:MAG: hypothetical protein EWV82_12830 [Microcystis aeruginosa Ma_AC_P_19900807_S299]TRU29277.1 MAG: hypothetical protein EWV81_03110 [Microcystis aeruginosa Ma_SC_T_19800800_S464]